MHAKYQCIEPHTLGGMRCFVRAMGRMAKVTITLDSRSLKVYKTNAGRMGISLSALLRVLASKLESGEIRL